MTSKELQQLCRLLSKFKARIVKEQPLAAQVIELIFRWVDADDGD